MQEEYKAAARFLSERAVLKPEVGIICGSGLSGLSKAMTETQVFNYNDIPGFPHVHVGGHVGELVFGKLAGVPTVCMRGRFHFYEGHHMSKVVMPVRVMRCIGVKALVVTNAAGGLNPHWNIGDVMCMTDHFGCPMMTGHNPLMGPNLDEMGPRFAPVSNAYDPKMQEVVMKAAKTLGFDFVRPAGCYAMVSGPSYEAPREAMWLRQLGADCVGMSTVPEIITAHHAGMKIVGLSLITNKVIMPGDEGPHASHAEVLEETAKRGDQMQALVKQIVHELKDGLDAMDDLPKIDISAKAGKFAVSYTRFMAMISGGAALLGLAGCIPKK